MLFASSFWLVTQTLTEVAAAPLRPTLICHNEVILQDKKVQICMNCNISTILPKIGSSACVLLVVLKCITGGPASRPEDQCRDLKGKSIHPFIHVPPPVAYSTQGRREAGSTQSVSEERA